MPTRADLLLALSLCASCGGDATGRLDPTLVHTVERGDLVITVRERGELQAAEDTRVSSELEGRATLIFLVEEGSIVETGTKLAELDVSAIEEKRAMQAIQVAKAEAALIQARKNVEIMEKELLAAEKTAESRLHIAKLRLQKFLGQAKGPVDQSAEAEPGTNADMIARLEELLAEGARTASEPEVTAAAELQPVSFASSAVDRSELLGQLLETLGPRENLQLEMGELSNQVLQMMDEINLARADLELAKDTLTHSRRLHARNFITRNELARDEITFKRQLSRETVAWNNLSLLVKYTLPETLITLQQEIENAQLGLESVRASGEARRVREKADLQSSEAEHRLAKGQLDTLVEQTRKAVLRAPSPGLVVYGRWDWDEPVYEGMEVRERQEIVILPDITTMVARLEIHESQIGKLAAGQSATVRIDAFPSRTFTGRVTEVATLPEPTRRSSDPKVFAVRVTLDVDNSAGTLRPSMNGTVVVDVGTLRDVVSVPLTALERVGDDHFVWKLTADDVVATRVDLGGNNLTHVEIVGGLREGDRIYLVRPSGAQLPDAGAAREPAPALERPAADDVPEAAVPANGTEPAGGDEQR